MAIPPTLDTDVFVVKSTVHRAVLLGAADGTGGPAQVTSQCDTALIGSQVGGRRAVRAYRSVRAGHLCERCFPEGG